MRCRGIVQRRGLSTRVASTSRRRLATYIEVGSRAEQRSSVHVGPLRGVRRCSAQPLWRKMVVGASAEPHRADITRCARLPAPRSPGIHAGVGAFVVHVRPGRVVACVAARFLLEWRMQLARWRARPIARSTAPLWAPGTHFDSGDVVSLVSRVHTYSRSGGRSLGGYHSPVLCIMIVFTCAAMSYTALALAMWRLGVDGVCALWALSGVRGSGAPSITSAQMAPDKAT